jgi:hypothetical protein
MTDEPRTALVEELTKAFHISNFEPSVEQFRFAMTYLTTDVESMSDEMRGERVANAVDYAWQKGNDGTLPHGSELDNSRFSMRWSSASRG